MAFSIVALVTAPQSLMVRLATLPDVRKRRSIRHAYVTLLTIALPAIAASCTSLLAIGQWAAGLTPCHLEGGSI